MKKLLQIEVQMQEGKETSEELVKELRTCFKREPFVTHDIDDIDKTGMTMSFITELMQLEIMQAAADFIVRNRNDVHYIDVVYRYEYELNADRFVFWSDGRVQEYTGKMMFTEVRTNE